MWKFKYRSSSQKYLNLKLKFNMKFETYVFKIRIIH